MRQDVPGAHVKCAAFCKPGDGVSFADGINVIGRIVARGSGVTVGIGTR